MNLGLSSGYVVSVSCVCVCTHVYVLINYRILANDILYFLQFIENIIEEGKKSPRTIRLAALHLTGLWLSNPRTIKYYVKELKLLSLYGSGVYHALFSFSRMISIIIWLSLLFHIQLLVICDISFAVAFDEDFEGELADNPDARSEVSLLAKSTSPELTEVSYLIWVMLHTLTLSHTLRWLPLSPLDQNPIIFYPKSNDGSGCHLRVHESRSERMGVCVVLFI